jgi:hypothetical protein
MTLRLESFGIDAGGGGVVSGLRHRFLSDDTGRTGMKKKEA